MRRAWRKWRVRAIVYAALLTPPSLILLSAFAGRPNDGGPLPTIAGPSYLSRIQPDFTRIARQTAGKGEVRCWSDADWVKRAAEFADFNHLRIQDGVAPASAIPAYLSPDRKRINMHGAICNGLLRFLAGENLNARSVYSARVLAQMVWHLKGERSETKASCYGVQTVRALGRELGASPEDADALARLAWSQHEAREPSPECHDGGEFDLRPASPVWP